MIIFIIFQFLFFCDKVKYAIFLQIHLIPINKLGTIGVSIKKRRRL